MESFLVAVLKLRILMFLIASIAASLSVGQEITDQDPDLRVARPAYRKKGPKVLFDEAHFNVHTSSGRSKAFADLLVNDGYRVIPNKEKLDAKNLREVDILVIVSALGANRDINPDAAGNPAFTEHECDVVKNWVGRGGSLLLIVDHEPTGAAAQNLAKRFEVEMSDGTTMDSATDNHMKGCNGCMRFTRENGLLRDHPIVRGRNSKERIRGIENGVGQSLKGPPGSTAFLKLADTAYDELPGGKIISAAGRAQGIAFKFGRGRVVVLGEAAMLAGQGPRPGQKFRRWWLDYPGIDNRQLALNILHWLSGLLN